MRDTVVVRSQLAVLGLAMVVSLGGAAGAVPAHAPQSAAVKPLQWTIEGNILDYICPDATPYPLQGQSPHV